MNEIQKARLYLAMSVAAFLIFIFCIVFGGYKIFQQLNRTDDTPNTVASQTAQAVSAPRIKKLPEVRIVKKTKVEPSVVKLDDSRALRSFLPAWKRYRRPKCGILADVTNNKILWTYNADRIVPIASMSKMLTLYMALNVMQQSNNKLTLKNNVKLTPNSAMGREGGFGFKAGDVYTLEDLMKSATIRSANDAAGAIAVFFGGTEKKFVAEMNVEAKKLGMKNSSFINPHGLPEKNKDNLSTMNDMLILSMKLLKNKDYMRWAKMKAAKIGSKTIVNTNNLMRKRKYPGVDGLKTGYTKRAGFCLAFSCNRNGRRLVGVVAGFPSAADRENFLTALLDWAYCK